MSYKVALKEESTGQILLCHIDEDWYDITRWAWRDGSKSCDCARRVIFKQAQGEGDERGPCGQGGYTVLYIQVGKEKFPPEKLSAR